MRFPSFAIDSTWSKEDAWHFARGENVSAEADRATPLSPLRVFLVVLLVVFVAEVSIMFVLPVVVSSTVSKGSRAFVDAGMLTIVAAPILWWIIIGPLRRMAIVERAKAFSIVWTAADGIITIDSQGRIRSVNPAAERLLGCSAEKIIYSPLSDWLPSLDLEGQQMSRSVEAVGRRCDGTAFPASVALSKVRLENEYMYTAIISDLTESKRAEAERLFVAREKEAMRAQQMATLAQLATGVAHEIRNPLTSVKMLVQSNREELESNGLPSEDLKMVEEEIRRMERTLSTFLDFARPAKLKQEPVCLNAVIQRTLALIEGRAGKQNVQIRYVLPDSSVTVLGDWEQLQQLLLNLTLNALDVLPNGGLLALELTENDEGIELSVRDSGPGIPADVFARIFDPFFTTKETGVGLGLGICKRIVEEHGGRLVAEQPNESGACFVMRLPSGETPSRLAERKNQNARVPAQVSDDREIASDRTTTTDVGAVGSEGSTEDA